MPFMRDKTGPFAESARAALLDRWAFRDDSDDSDASDDEGERRGAEYYRLPARMRRHAARAGVSAAVGMFGQGPVVVAAIAASLGWSTAAVTRCVALIERRARENAALRWERSACIARRQAVERLTGGASLALVLGSGAVKVSSMSQGVRRIAAGLGRVESPPSRWSIARVTADAHVDVAAAGLPAASRRWAVRQALRVAAELEVDDWTRADLHALRALGAELRSSDAVACAQERTGNALPIVGPEAVAAAGEEAGSGAHQAMEASTLGSDTLSRLLCRVFLRYACRLHSTNSLHPLSAPPPPRPVRPPPDPPVCQTASTIPTTGKQQQRLLFRWIRTATRGSQVTATSLRCQRRRLCGAVGARAPCTALSRSPPARAAIADILTCCVPPVTMGTWRQPWAPGLRNRLRCFASAEPSSVAETRAGWRGLCPGRLAAVWRRTRMPKGGPTRIARRSSRR